MLSFFLHQFSQAVSAHRIWLLSALVPVLIYLVATAVRPDRFLVKQEISISENSLISLSPKAADLKAVKELTANPDAFFLNSFALVLLAKQFDANILPAQSDPPRKDLMALKGQISQCLSLTKAGTDKVVLIYEGKDRKAGELMVPFYSQRLIKQAEDWLKQNRGRVEGAPSPPKLLGKITVEEQRAPWRMERLLPAMYLFLGAFLLILVLIAIVGWFKPSFRSERHMAYTLKVPILGTLPDLKGFSDSIKRG